MKEIGIKISPTFAIVVNPFLQARKTKKGMGNEIKYIGDLSKKKESANVWKIKAI